MKTRMHELSLAVRNLARFALLGSLLLACGEEATPETAPDDASAIACEPAHDHAHGDVPGHSHSHAGADCADGGAAVDAGAGAVADAGTSGDAAAEDGGFAWNLPPDFPLPIVPEDNPMSAEKVELGRHLFYDKRLSGNQTQSCASCHKQERAFADERAVGLGSTGELHTRGSMSLANVAYAMTLTWSNPVQLALERQAEVPLFGDQPVELGMPSMEELEQRVRGVPRYKELFREAFPGEDEPITMLNVKRAIAAFERTLISGNSPFDRSRTDPTALSESAKRGMIFVTTNEDHRFECNHCHGGFNFSDHTTFAGASTDIVVPFHQTGLYNVDGQGSYPAPNTGAHGVTLKPEDMGKFKAPTLRNIALTAPYMHDGSIATLSEVLDHYAKGGRARHGRKTDELVRPFPITEQEKADIIAFLEALTDQEFITNPKFSDPWRPVSEPASAAKPEQ